MIILLNIVKFYDKDDAFNPCGPLVQILYPFAQWCPQLPVKMPFI